MNVRRPRRIDRDTAERLLSGAVVDPQDGPDVLVRLLAAMRATPQPGELVDESAAMEAFRAAHLGPTLQPRRRSMLETALAKLLTLKVAAAATVTVAATGGVALAAANGALPNPLSSDSPKASPSAHATGKPEATDKSKADDKNAGTPSPSLVGLCRAYKAGAGSADNSKALENPAFSVLITTAGGKEKVAAYCDALLAQQKGKPSAPAGGSDNAPTTHPTGKPDSRPTAPESKPTGAPVDRMTPPPGGTSK